MRILPLCLTLSAALLSTSAATQVKCSKAADTAVVGRILAEVGVKRAVGEVVEFKVVYDAPTGPIPAEIGRLVGLRRLPLNGADGELPRETGNLTNLTHLGSGNLSVPPPRETGGLTQLESIQIGGGNLTGPLPKEIGKLVGLRVLQIRGNNLSGPLPKELGRLGHL